MKQSIAWHEECLKNREATIARYEAELEEVTRRLNGQISRGKAEVAFYIKQIEAAKAQKKTALIVRHFCAKEGRMSPYPGPIDSAAAYFQVLAHYARQGCVLRFAHQGDIPETIVLYCSGIPGAAFIGESPQACLLQLQEWVVFERERAEEGNI